MLTWNGGLSSHTKKSNSTDGYKLVPKDDVPHMTFKGYQQLKNLEPETIDYLSISKEYPVRIYDNLWKIFQDQADKKNPSTPQQLNLALYKRIDPDLGTASYLVRAARDLKKGQAICFVGGQLSEDWKIEDPYLLDTSCFQIKADDLHDYFEYPRDGPNLVLDMSRHINITKFIRDPADRLEGEGPNIATDLILHRPAKMVVLVLYTLDDISKDEEVFCSRFVGSTKRSTHQNMVLAARVSHYYHRYACKLEQEALIARINLEEAHQSAQALAAKRKIKKLTPVEQRFHMRGVDPKQKSVPIPPPVSEFEHQALKQRALAEQRRDAPGSRVLNTATATSQISSSTNSARAASSNKPIVDLADDEEMKEETEHKESTNPLISSTTATSSVVSPTPPNLSSLSLTAQATDSNTPLAAASSAPDPYGYSSSPGQTSYQIEHDMMKLMDTQAAFAQTGCEQICRSTLGSSVTQPTRISMYGITSPQYPEVIVIDGQKYPFQEAEMEYLLQNKVGYRPEKLEVREICSLSSPCRYFCPPWYRSFCVVSKVQLRKAELLVIYSGEMEQQIQHRCSSYVYNLPTSEGVSHFGKAYSAIPDLMIDAACKGNIGRFINDNMFRNGEYQDEAAANIGVTWVYDSIPHLVFYAKKDIGPGEELISSYGQEFWDVMCRQSMRGHSAYYQYIRPYTTAIEKLLLSKGLTPPEKPDVIIERNPEFLPKLRPYHPPPEDSSDDEEEEEEEETPASSSITTAAAATTPTKKKKSNKKPKKKAAEVESEGESEEYPEFMVERIIGKKFMPNGTVKYQVKWLHYDLPEDNTWEPLGHLEDAAEAVGEFEQKLKRLGLEVGEEPLPEPEIKDHDGDAKMDEPSSSSPVALTGVPPPSAPTTRKLKKKKHVNFRNAQPATKKVSRKDLPPEQRDAILVDLTEEDETPIRPTSTASTTAPVAAASTPPSYTDAPSSYELKFILSTMSKQGRKRVPSSLSVESSTDELSAPAASQKKRRTSATKSTLRPQSQQTSSNGTTNENDDSTSVEEESKEQSSFAAVAAISPKIRAPSPSPASLNSTSSSTSISPTVHHANMTN